MKIVSQAAGKEELSSFWEEGGSCEGGAVLVPGRSRPDGQREQCLQLEGHDWFQGGAWLGDGGSMADA